MRDETVARSYAETLFALAQRHEGLEAFGEGIATVARMLDENPRFRLFLETPRIADTDKKDVVRRVFESTLPPHLVNFLQITIDKRRQRLLRTIARQYALLVDAHEGRTHVEVTVARPIDQATHDLLSTKLSELLGTRAIPHVRVKPEILGGVVVRTGDMIYDGSVRKSLERMRSKLLKAQLPGAANAAGVQG